jgi:radical SAM protein with 4Fe4S-binding SPASM domain
MNMPFEVAKKIINDAVSNGIESFALGENGDALLNQDFLNIARYIRYKSPNAYIRLYTNFRNLTPAISKIIIDENLLTLLVCNIDGHDAESYERMKGINYSLVERNILEFLRIRKERISVKPIFLIQVMTYHRYRQCLLHHFWKVPDCMSVERPDDYDEIFNKWKDKIGPGDGIFKLFVKGWAARELCSSKGKEFSCPEVRRIDTEAFVAPNGDWYACCWMEDQNVVFGNLMEQSIEEIYNSDKRRQFIEMLRDKRFEEIGHPCDKVEACQEIREEAPLTDSIITISNLKVLVVSPVADFVKECVASWFAIDWAPIEYYILRTGEIIGSTDERDDNEYRRRVDAITRGRNQILERVMQMEWDYLLWVDSDVSVPKDILIKMMKYTPKEKVITAVAKYRDIPGRRTNSSVLDYRDKDGYAKWTGWHCVLVAREVHEAVGFFTEAMADDIGYSALVRHSGYNICIAEDVKVDHQYEKTVRLVN